MENLVIYDSLYGNTQKVAEAVAEAIKGKSVRVQDFKPEMLDGVSLLIVGCPVHAWNPSKPTTEFLSSLPANSLNGKYVAAFDTRIKIFFSGSASDKVERKLIDLEGKAGGLPAAFIVKGKEGPLVEGELGKAKEWAGRILEKIGV